MMKDERSYTILGLPSPIGMRRGLKKEKEMVGELRVGKKRRKGGVGKIKKSCASIDDGRYIVTWRR